MSVFASPLSITGYKYPTFSIFGYIGTYYLQLNPADISITVGQNEEERTEGADALGSAVTSKAPVHLQRTLDFSFILDNTGAVPYAPDGMNFFFGNIAQSIKSLEKLTVEPVSSTHRPPYVRVSWGLGAVSIYGSVSSFKYDYTFFDGYGIPLRAKVTMSVQDFDSDGASLFQSPDITKMPTVKDGDNIVRLSEEYYDDKKYYVKLAEFNGLSSLRNLKNGSLIQVPPLN
jgi:hypothetical protein